MIHIDQASQQVLSTTIASGAPSRAGIFLQRIARFREASPVGLHFFLRRKIDAAINQMMWDMVRTVPAWSA